MASTKTGWIFAVLMGGAAATFSADAAAEEGEAEISTEGHNILVDALTDLGSARSAVNGRRMDFEEATMYAEKCVSRLEEYFPSHPAEHKLPAGGSFRLGDKPVTYELLIAACKRTRTEIVETQKEKAAARHNELEKQLRTCAGRDFVEGTTYLAEARKGASAKNFVDAYLSYRDAVRELEETESLFKQALHEDPTLAAIEIPIGKSKEMMSMQKIFDTASKLLPEAQKETETVKGQAVAQEQALEAALQKSLQGDRKKLADERGLPSWWQGADLADVAPRNKAIVTSPYWRYDSSSGCKITYRFSGNKRTKIERSPAGCN